MTFLYQQHSSAVQLKATFDITIVSIYILHICCSWMFINLHLTTITTYFHNLSIHFLRCSPHFKSSLQPPGPSCCGSIAVLLRLDATEEVWWTAAVGGEDPATWQKSGNVNPIDQWIHVYTAYFRILIWGPIVNCELSCLILKWDLNVSNVDDKLCWIVVLFWNNGTY